MTLHLNEDVPIMRARRQHYPLKDVHYISLRADKPSATGQQACHYLMYLTIRAVPNHLNQLKYTGWVLEGKHTGIHQHASV